MKDVEILEIEELPEGISVVLTRSGKTYQYFRDWDGKEALQLRKSETEVAPYHSYRLIRAARKSHGFPLTKSEGATTSQSNA